MNVFNVLCLLLAAYGGGAYASVIGGSNANIANHAWQASLRNGGNHVCGAVLIANTRAITAAHCGGSAITSYSILAGTSERTVQTCATCALRNPILTFPRHPDFINNAAIGYPNDIAVLTFYSIATNVNIRYVPMAEGEENNFAGVNCVVSGWGREVANGPLPTTLQEGSMTAESNEACAATWGVNRINAGHICAAAAGVTACGGDDGGPLVCEGQLAGVFSWGEANCSPAFAAVFSRISFFRAWILEH